jgi:hypothetical protein
LATPVANRAKCGTLTLGETYGLKIVWVFGAKGVHAFAKKMLVKKPYRAPLDEN